MMDISEFGNVIDVLYLTKRFSPETEKVIKENVTPSMISQDESSKQYLVDEIKELLMNDEIPILITYVDFKIIEICIEDKIGYIEF